MLCHYEQAGAGPAALTPREREVLDYVVAGKSNKLIAIELGLSMRTVEAYRARVFFKMGVRNAVELARRVYAPQSWGTPAATLLEPGPASLRAGAQAGRAAGAAAQSQSGSASLASSSMGSRSG